VTEFLTLVVLGLCSGAVTALSAHGVVVIYRGSGVLNLSHAAMGSLAAFIYWDLHDNFRLGFWVAAVVGIAVAAACGLVVQLLVLTPMKSASPITKLVATLAVLVVVQNGLQLYFGPQELLSAPVLPTALLHIFGMAISENQLILLGIAAGITIALQLAYRYSRFGIATTATAENRRAAAALGLSSGLIAALNWMIGAALAGLAAVLLAPISQVQLDTQSSLIVPVLAAALLGGMRSFPLTFLGGVVVGISQALVGTYVPGLGWSDAVPFVLIALVMVVRGRGISGRPEPREVRPRIGSGQIRPWAATAFVAVVVVLIQWVANPVYLGAITLTICVGLILLSSVVITGYAGQLSLCQFAIAGTGAVIAGLLDSEAHVPFFWALLCAIAGSFVVGLVVGVPALRARGINLALATLGLGAAVQSVLLLNPSYTGGMFVQVPVPHFLGLSLDTFTHPRAYAIFCFVFLLLAAALVANLRRGAAGRRIIAVRSNERAAAAQGINVFGAKLYAFALSAAIAGTGGVLLVFRQTSLTFDQFAPDQSINGVLYSVVGGIGYIFGPVLGSLGEPAGIVPTIFNGQDETFDLWLALVLGLLTIPLLHSAPDGLFVNARNQAAALLRWLHVTRPAASGAAPVPLPAAGAATVPPRRLEVSGLTVTFGSVVALDDFCCTVEPGKVLGIIGPNGAGKTTMIEAVTGFVKPASGIVSIDGVRIDGWKPHRRVRAGIGRTFQSLELFDDMTVAENLRAPADARERWSYARDLLWPRRKQMPGIAVAAVREFRLESDLAAYPDQLSYGKRRLVAIARSLSAAPSILCLDEPAAGLSIVERRELAHMLRRLTDEWGIAILLIEHDVELVMSVCDEVIAIQFGKTIAGGAPDAVRSDPVVIEAYLGSDGAAASAPTADGSGLPVGLQEGAQ
jgi:ABC-type branched-subunit amino acid transport system ATPase component/branched-subunit amino acid ABC-type transport system permease component